MGYSKSLQIDAETDPSLARRLRKAQERDNKRRNSALEDGPTEPTEPTPIVLPSGKSRILVNGRRPK